MYRYDLDWKTFSSLSYLYKLTQMGSDLKYRYSKSGEGIHLLSVRPLQPHYFCQGFEDLAQKRGVKIMFVKNVQDWQPLTTDNLLNVWNNLRSKAI